MKRKVLTILMALTMTAALCACGDKKEPASTTGENSIVDQMKADKEEAPEEAPEVEEAAVEEEEIPEGMYLSELTNEPIDESLKQQRPIAAMVDNELTALPHFGLADADIVYEMMNSTKNGRITRFMVMVKDWEKIEQLGSIRSVRPTNILLAAEWNAVLCHDGGPFYVDYYFKEDYADHFSGLFSRVNNGKAREFTEYIMPGDLEKAFANSKVSREYNQHYPGAHYQFASKSNPVDLTDKSGARNATKIELPFEHNGSYLEYDEATQTYKYFEYNKAHVDGASGEQLAFKNLLIQYCTFNQLDENGYMIFNCLDAGKDAYYITNGKAIPCTWNKLSATDQTRYYDAEGNEITINTGKTYVALVPHDDWSKLVIK